MKIKTKITMMLAPILFLVGSATSSTVYGEEIFNKEMLNMSRPINTHQIPHLAAISIAHFDDYFPITVVEDSNIRDTAQASRVYRQFEKTEQCVISVNMSSGRGLTNERISPEKLELFVYLHEIAHCADTELPPPGVNKDDWLEALADGYASAIMLQNNSLNRSQIGKLASYRSRTHNEGAAKMNYYLSREENNPQTWNAHSEEEILAEVKKIRRKLFES